MRLNVNNGPNFNGLYIVKGTNKRVDKVTMMIRSVCNNSQVQDTLAFEAEANGMNYIAPLKLLKNFTDCAYHYLTGAYGVLQPLTQNLIATNEHADIIKDFMLRKTLDFGSEPLSIKMLEEKILDLLLGSEEENEAYEYAKEQCDKGNAKPLADFVVQSQIKAKKCLNEILEPCGYSASDIKVLNVDDVLESMEKGQFNPVTGALENNLKEN